MGLAKDKTMSIESAVETEVESVVDNLITSEETSIKNKLKTAYSYWMYWTPIVFFAFGVGHIL